MRSRQCKFSHRHLKAPMVAPEGWTVVRLADLAAAIQYGYTASASARNVGPRLVRITDLQQGHVDWDSVPRCECDEPDDYALAAGDLLIARTGAASGKSYLVTSVPEPAVYASYLIRIKFFDQEVARYVALFMR